LLFTENLNDGQSYGGILARNPFRSTGPVVANQQKEG
jgi:hypothetical protein